MTDFSWAKLAEDPNAVQWDEEAQANLQKLIADYERVKAERDQLAWALKELRHDCDHCFENDSQQINFAIKPPEGGWPVMQTCKHCSKRRKRKLVFEDVA